MYRSTVSCSVYLLIFTVSVFLYGHGTLLAQTDEDMSLEGWFSIIWGDGLPGTGETHEVYFLTTLSGETTRLFINEELAQSAGGVLSLDRKFVAVQGNMPAQKSLAISSPTLQVTSISLLSMGQVEEETIESDVSPGVSGSKPWVTIMCKFADFNDEPKDLAYFTDMYTNVKPGFDHYWRELSYNTVNIAGSNAYGWFTLPQNEIYYNPTDSQGGADLDALFDHCVAAANETVNFSSYSGINMMFNTNFDNGFAWGGSRYEKLDGVTKLFSVTWEPPWGYSDIAVIAHEMGHGFGLPHSSGMYGATYDNEWDVMSDTWSNCSNSRDVTYGCLGQHTIAYHKDRLGWIPAGQKHVADGTKEAITLDNLAIPSTPNYRMIKIPVNGSSSHYYTIEVRQKSGYDIKLPGKAVVIHEVNTMRLRPANVVDIDGDGDTGDEGARWTVGETYANTDYNFIVEVLAETTNGFIVEVQFTDPKFPWMLFLQTIQNAGAK